MHEEEISMSRFWVRMSVLGVSAIAYILLLYATPRHVFPQLMGLFSLLFLGYVGLIWKNGLFISSASQPPSITRREIWIAALLFRLIAVFALPQLSDDYFRFVWDGRLLTHGENPFSQLPIDYLGDSEAFQTMGLTEELYEGLNSKEYYTIYPPVNQFVFAIGTRIFPHSIYGAVVVMKLLILAAELGTIWVLMQLLALWGKPREWAAIYALNPLVIVELCGNLHFEAHMIFFLLLSIWLLATQRWRIAILPFALSIGSKLLPLMAMPLLLRRLGIFRLAVFGIGVLGIVGLMFAPLMNTTTWAHFRESVDLYFLTFEFNASVYYVARWIGFYVRGYNIIGTIGAITPWIVFGGVWLSTLLEKGPRWQKLPMRIMECLILYFAVASIVHPWYIISILALSVLTPYRFPIAWAALLPLTYFAYRNVGQVEENLWLVGGIYVLVGIVWLREWVLIRRSPASNFFIE